MSVYSVADFSALIGIDWADQKHDVCEVPATSRKPIFSVISSKPQSVHEWASDLKKRYPNKPVAVACELKTGPLIYALEKYSHIVLFPINPSTVAKYRKAFTVSGAKDDPSDALIQAEMLERHMDKMRCIEPEDPNVRALRQIVEGRRKLVQDRVKLTNKITTVLKSYYPQVLDWFKEKDTIVFCNFIEKWPSLNSVKKARKQTLITFFNQHNSRYSAVNDRRLADIKNATPLTEDNVRVAKSAHLSNSLWRGLFP